MSILTIGATHDGITKWVERPEANRLENAKWIAQLVTEGLTLGYGLFLEAAVQYADGKIPTEQRFYDIEYVGAAQILFKGNPKGMINPDNPYLFLRNKMGWRLVPMIQCRYGFVLDPVSRDCVSIFQPPVEPPPIEPPPVIPPPHALPPDDKRAGILGMPSWALIVGGGLLLFIATRR